MIFQLDREGRLIAVSEFLLGEAGYEEAEALGRPFTDFLDPDEVPRLLDAFQTVLGGEMVHAIDHRLRRGDGSWMRCQTTGWPVRNASGEIEGAQGVTLDTTRQHRTQVGLERLNECFLSFTARPEENIQKIVETAGQVLEATCTLYSRLDAGKLQLAAHWHAPEDFPTENEVEGTPCGDVARRASDAPWVVSDLDASDYAQTDPHVRRYGLKAYAGCAVKVGGLAVGTMCVVYGHERSFAPEELQFLQILARALSIEEERRRIAEQTHIEKQVLESAIENAPLGLVILDRAGRVRLWNRYMEEEYAVPARELLGRDLMDSFPAAEREGFEDWIEKVTATGKPLIDPEWVHTTRNVGRRTIDLRVYPLRDRAGNATGVAFTNLDVTERKRAEAERDKLRQQLFAAQKMQSIATLAGGIAHDFNNLLGTILLDMRLLESYVPDEPDPRDLLSGMNRAVVQMTNLTQQLLAFARGGAHSPRPMSVNRSAERALKLVRRTFDPRIRVHLRLDPELKNVEADPTQIEQIVANLLRNAAEAMIEGPGEITLATENAAAPDVPSIGTLLRPGDPVVRLVVQDTGCGMDDLTVARIFEPFYSTKFPGRGLGMAAVLGIVRNHGGIVEVKSELGRGTRVDVCLPVTDRPVPNEALEGPLEGACGGETILVAEGEDLARRALVQLLEGWGFRVLEARATAQAASLLEGSPDTALVIICSALARAGPDDGFLPQARRRRPGLKVLVLTGEPIAAVREEFGLEGANGILEKPFPPEDLAREIRRLLGAI